VEVFWAAKPEWRRSQSMVIESMLSSIEEFGSRVTEPYQPKCAINYCPFCSSSFVRIDNILAAEHRYRCGDCDMTWTMIDPVV
jgi:transposase-like protein